MDKKTCIVCKKRFTENSVEHIVPNAIGGKVHINCVCRTCNTKLGHKVDCLLTENTTILSARHILGITNRDGKKVNYYKLNKFYDSNNNRVIIKRGDGRQMPLIYDGSLSPQVDVSQDENGKAHVRLRTGSDFDSVFIKAQRELKKNGFTMPDDELRRELFSNVKVEFGYTVTKTPLTINVEKMTPCICKIAYEASHMILGDPFLSDPLAEQYRKLLFSLAYDKKPDNVHEQVTVEFQLDQMSEKNTFRLFKAGNTLMAQIVILGFFRFYLPVSRVADKYTSICETTSEISL